MKLIIDIPDEMYDCIKKDTESEMYIIDVIKKGTPYNLKGDLISRSDLKEKAYTAVILEPDEKGIDYVKGKRYVVDLEDIDNAPTVHTEDCEGCPYCPNSNSGIPIGVE